MRIAQMSAHLVEKYDVLVEMGYDSGGQRTDLAKPIGRVLEVIKDDPEGEHPDRQYRSWKVQTPDGEVITYPEQPRPKLMLTYIHVPVLRSK